MPWKAHNVPDLRRELVRLVREEGVKVTAAAKAMGVARKTAYKWLERFESEGRVGLEDRSRAPLTSPTEIDAAVAARLISIRRQHPSWGPRQILDRLVHQGEDRSALPSHSTLDRIFRREQLTRRRSRVPKMPAGSGRPAKSDAPNGLWTADFKGDFRLGNGERCYPLTIQDTYSRYVLSVRALPGTHAHPVRREIRALFEAFGVPDAFQSDNGIPFAAPGPLGLSRLAVDLMKQDVVVDRSRVGCPQDNGSHERMHRDLKAETTRPPCQTMRGQQCRFTHWLRDRNDDRPHQGIGGVTPSSLYEPSRRAYRAKRDDWEYPRHLEVKKVKSNGQMKWRSDAVFVSTALAGEHIGLEEIDDRLWSVWYRRNRLGVFNARADRDPKVTMPHPWWRSKAGPASGTAR